MSERLSEFWERNVPMSFADKKLSYTQKRDFRYKLQDYMQEVFRFADFRGKKVLDLGCGAGIDSVEFARHGAIVTSLDFSKTAVRLTKELFEEAGVRGHVVLGDAENLRFPDESFDCVYSFGVLHHIPDVRPVLMEIVRVLKRHGTFMGMVYNSDSLMHAMLLLRACNVREKYLGVSIEDLAGRMTERVFGVDYSKLYTKGEAMELFSQYFVNVTVETHYNVIDTDCRRKLKFDLEDKNADFGWHLTIRGEKR